MSNDKVLGDKDIDNIWRSVKSVSSDDAKRMIRNTGIVRPITTSDDYFALLSLDIHNGERKEYHLLISNPLGIVKFQIAVAMTVGESGCRRKPTGEPTKSAARLREIATGGAMTREIGDCDQLHVRFRDIYHFLKSADEEGIHKINKNKEEKLKYGKGVEGDINNGIERRVKKKIQIEGVVERSHRVR